jgi:hypothetical protein
MANTSIVITTNGRMWKEGRKEGTKKNTFPVSPFRNPSTLAHLVVETRWETPLVTQSATQKARALEPESAATVSEEPESVTQKART